MRILALDDMEERHVAFRKWFKGHDLVCAYTAQGAIRALQAGPRFELVQLDHDLAAAHYVGDIGPGTGMDVVDYISAMPKPLACPERVVVHSWNGPRAEEMVRRLQEAGVWARWRRFSPGDPPPFVK